MEFQYTAGFPDDPWDIRVKMANNGGSAQASVYKNGKLIMQLNRTAFGWGLYGRMKLEDNEPAAIVVNGRLEFAWDEISAVTEAIETELEKTQKNPNKSGFKFGN